MKKMNTTDNTHNTRECLSADIAVAGGGASGCMAAVAAARCGKSVLILEGNDAVLKKLAATGNGRCNLTNLSLSDDDYHSDADCGVLSYISPFGRENLLSFFEKEGVFFHDRDGYVYPHTDQASTVTNALRKMLRDAGVVIKTGERVTRICGPEEKHDGGYRFRLETAGGDICYANAVIAACGGMAGTQFGCRGDGYELLKALGHSCEMPRPALSPLVTDDASLRIGAGARAVLCGTLCADGKSIGCEYGQYQFNADSISGIPALQLSHAAGEALLQGRETILYLNFLPQLSEEAFLTECKRRLFLPRSLTLGELLFGLAADRLIAMILCRSGLQPEMKCVNLSRISDDPESLLRGILASFRAYPVRITSVGDYDRAQVTAGGIPMHEIGKDFSSAIVPHLYITGELLNVDGRCGGYNLQWAMSSGYLAGKSAGEAL